MDPLGRARYLLDHPEEAGLSLLLDGKELLLRVIHIPAFDRQRSWSVYRPRNLVDDPRLLVLRIAWDPREPRHSVGAPVVTNRVGYLETTQLDVHLQSRPRVPMPLTREEETQGLDGEGWALETGSPFNGVRVHWWCDGPDVWRPLVEWTRRLAALLDAVVTAPP